MQDRFLRALTGQPVDRTPVWLMRQAGRYLPEYRATREVAGQFMTLCQTPELACEVTLQPLARFPLDAAILFSDILTIPDAMGLGLHFSPGEGPQFERPLRSRAAIEALPPAEALPLDYVYEAVRLIKPNLSVPLIGFAGSPWTLACYMVEGRGSKDFATVKALAYENPEALQRLLERLTAAVSHYLRQQVAAGVDCVMIFDTWGGLLPHWAYEIWSLAPMRQIIQTLDVPAIIFTKGGGQWLTAQASSGAAGLGLDWTTSLATARQLTGDRLTLQGNLDPALLTTHPATVEREVQRVLADYGHGHRHIFNLGHGITPDAKPDNVQALLEAVWRHSPAYKN